MWPQLIQQLIRQIQPIAQRALPVAQRAVQRVVQPLARFFQPATPIVSRAAPVISRATQQYGPFLPAVPQATRQIAQQLPRPQPLVSPAPSQGPIGQNVSAPQQQSQQTYNPSTGTGQTTGTGATTDPNAQILTPEQQIDQALLQSVQSLQDESNRLFSEYNQKYPFIFDEVLKQKTKEAMQQQGIGPEAPETTFYNEKLSDYLLGVDRKKGRGIQSANQLLSELQRQTQSYSQDTQLRLQQALNRATSGYADIGLGSSGERYGAEGALKAGYQQNVEDFMGGQQLRAGQEQQSLDRYLQDLSLGKQTDVRNLYRESGEAVKTLAGQLTKEQGQKYTTGFQATLPPQYQGLQSNQSLDLLKQIGIYS